MDTDISVSHSHWLNAKAFLGIESGQKNIVNLLSQSPESLGFTDQKIDIYNQNRVIFQRKSTIEHETTYIPRNDTTEMLKVRNLNKFMDRESDLMRKRVNLEKIKQYAVDKFGY